MALMSQLWVRAPRWTHERLSVKNISVLVRMPTIPIASQHLVPLWTHNTCQEYLGTRPRSDQLSKPGVLATLWAHDTHSRSRLTDYHSPDGARTYPYCARTLLGCVPAAPKSRCMSPSGHMMCVCVKTVWVLVPGGPMVSPIRTAIVDTYPLVDPQNFTCQTHLGGRSQVGP